MKKSYKKWDKREVESQLHLVGLKEVVRQELREFVVSAGMTALSELLEEERTQVCGPRYRHRIGRAARRAGHVQGELVMGGRRVAVRRPRARSVDGREVHLPSWHQFADEDPLHERALTQMIVGVSTRKYKRSLEPVATTLVERGTSKSAVSRRFVAITRAQMDEWLQRDLSPIDLAVVMLDGVHISDHVILVALGIDSTGQKHVLGIREGATENSTAATALLADLRQRGMSTERTTLFVLDGAKALRKAVLEVFADHARIQRCQAHKMRNVLDQLPEYMRPTVRATMRQAYSCHNVVHARKLLQNLARTLRADHPSAAGSLDEGLEETLTVMAMKLPTNLERVLSTTNAIENLIGSIRDLSRRVKRWRDGEMIVRWTATAVYEASTKFRRIAGHQSMSRLIGALRGREAVERQEQVG
jgi:transposase-like protein